jgi:hypothetical protein
MKFKYSKVTSVFLLIVISLLIPLGLYSNWVRATIGDQERFVETFAPLSVNPEIQNALNDSINVFIDTLDIDAALEENLPPALAPISGLLAASAKITLRNLSERIIYSEQFVTVWTQLATTIQSELIKVLEGETDTYLRASDEGLFVTIEPLRERLVLRVSETRALSFLVERIEAVELPKIEVLNADQLNFIVFVWNTNNILSVYIWPAIVLIAIAAVYLSGSAWKGSFYAGLSIAAGSLITLLSIYFVNYRLQNQLAEGIYGKTLSEIFSQMTIYLKNSAYWTLAVGFTVSIISAAGGYLKVRRATSN